MRARSDRFAISLCHHARRLGDVPEVMRDPRREQLAQRHASELRMLTFEGELSFRQRPAAQHRDVIGAKPGEFIEQRAEALAGTLAFLREPVVAFEAHARPLREDDPRAGIQSVRSP